MQVPVDQYGGFELDAEFVQPFAERPVDWGFGDLSWVTFKRTYSRDGEAWWQTCRRVIEGMFTVQRIHCLEHGLPFDEDKAQGFAREAYRRLFDFKWTPPGRGLWIMGTDFMYERGGAALNNCGFISTADIARDYAGPFAWMLEMSMLGVGVGFDTRGKGEVTIRPPGRAADVHTIADSREGWSQALARLLGAFVGQGRLPAEWDFAQIRPRGTKLESFGGFASGPEPLRDLLESVEELHRDYIGRPVDSRLLVDTMNLIGRCVVAGGTRRSAQIAFGEPDDRQFLDLKTDPDKVEAYRWASNHSVFGHKGMDYQAVAARAAKNGEPGVFWLDTARAFGRLADPANWRDESAAGANPCGEQTLWDRELCTLVETYPARHDSLQDFQQTLRLAYQYAKTVTLVATHDAKTNAVMLRNRRIGCSMSGIVQAINRHGYRRFMEWCDRSYGFIQHLDREYSNWLCVPRSIKTTTVKPSGTVSLLAGATPGVHWAHAPQYIRRMRVNENNPLAELCRQAGYGVEPDANLEHTLVVSFPVAVPHVERTAAEVSLREKVDLAAQLQHYWSDNQVSCTADFDPRLGDAELSRVLSSYEDRLKAITFLPRERHGYAQPPYEAISAATFEQMRRGLEPLSRQDGELPGDRIPAFCERCVGD